VPALFLTAYQPAECRSQAAAVGVEYVLQKAETSPRALAEAIRRQVEPITDGMA
jgi:CheY-like chemotaxis protein